LKNESIKSMNGTVNLRSQSSNKNRPYLFHVKPGFMYWVGYNFVPYVHDFFFKPKAKIKQMI